MTTVATKEIALLRQLHHALLQRQLDVVGVVGEAAHELAVGMLVKVAQRQLLQLVEQILAQLVAALLRQLGHQVGLEVGGGRHTEHRPGS